MKHTVLYEEHASTSGRQEYLCLFYHRLYEFRQPDAEAAAAIAGCRSVTWRMPHGNVGESPYWYMQLPAEGSEALAKQICDKAVLLKVRALAVASIQVSLGFVHFCRQAATE